MTHEPKTPGEAIREALDGRSQGWLTEHSGIAQPHVCALLKGRKRITPWVAIRLARCLNGSAEDWLVIQAKWDVEHEPTPDSRVEQEATA